MQCHHKSDGPPLKTYLFDLEDEAARTSMYAERITVALTDISTAFPGLSLQGRVAILVPHAQFLDELKPELLLSLRASFEGRFSLIDAAEANATVQNTIAFEQQW